VFASLCGVLSLTVVSHRAQCHRRSGASARAHFRSLSSVRSATCSSTRSPEGHLSPCALLLAVRLRPVLTGEAAAPAPLRSGASHSPPLCGRVCTRRSAESGVALVVLTPSASRRAYTTACTPHSCRYLERCSRLVARFHVLLGERDRRRRERECVCKCGCVGVGVCVCVNM
jgi:hypothetical protein